MSLNRTKFLEPHELDALRLNISGLSGLDVMISRNKTLITTALETGARASEVLNITRDDLYPDTNSVLIRGLKGSRDREIPVRPELMQALLRHIPFGIQLRHFERIWYSYRPVPKKLHSLRHTFAVNLYRKTKDIKLVQQALGHKSILNTQVYADFVYSQDEMRRILD